MEKVVRVKSQGTLQTVALQSGESLQKLALLLSDGIDTFEGEAFDSLAIQLNANPIAEGSWITVQCQMNVREWTSQQTGQVQRANSVRILKVGR